MFDFIRNFIRGGLDCCNLVRSRVSAAVVVAVFASLTVGACTPLKLFNTLAPVDPGSVLAKADAAYGSHPRQRLDVYTPHSKSEPAPVVIIVYGGSWNSGSKTDYAFLGKAFASRGFIAMVIDYRLVPEVRFPDFIEDCARAVKWAHDHARDFGGDPTRLFMLGHSAGAYNAVMVAMDPRFLQGVGAEPSIIRGVAGLAGPYDFLPLDVSATKEAFGSADNVQLTQPVNLVSGRKPAMFLATGADDTTVYPRNTLGLGDKLKRAGSPVTVRTYPDVGHVEILLALSVTFRGKAPVLADVVAFFNAQS